MSDPITLFCMRHGESEYNPLGLCNDNPSRPVNLTAQGQQQARDACIILQGEPIEVIISSELPRARQTAAIVGGAINVPIQIHPLLNDIRSGCDGLPVADYQKALAADPLHTRVNDGETLLEHKQRVLGFLNWLRTQPWHCLLAVAHEETLRVLAGHAQGLNDDDMIRLGFANCEIVRLDLDLDLDNNALA